MESSLVHRRAQVLILDLKITLIRFFCTGTEQNPTALKEQPHLIILPAQRMQKKSVRTQGEEIMTKHLKCHRVAAVGKDGKGGKAIKEKTLPRAVFERSSGKYSGVNQRQAEFTFRPAPTTRQGHVITAVCPSGR